MDDRSTDEGAQPTQARGEDNVLLVASLLHLMSHYSARSRRDEPCLKLASIIERHLTALSRLQGVNPVLRATCEQLRDTWGGLVDVKLPMQAKRSLFSRLASSNITHAALT